MKPLECSPISKFLRFKMIWSSPFDPPKNGVYFLVIQEIVIRRILLFLFFDFCNLDFYDLYNLYNLCLKIIHFLFFWPCSIAGGKTEIIIWTNLSFLWLANYVNIKFYIFGGNSLSMIYILQNYRFSKTRTFDIFENLCFTKKNLKLNKNFFNFSIIFHFFCDIPIIWSINVNKEWLFKSLNHFIYH